jgi:hypothetical protein
MNIVNKLSIAAVLVASLASCSSSGGASVSTPAMTQTSQEFQHSVEVATGFCARAQVSGTAPVDMLQGEDFAIEPGTNGQAIIRLNSTRGGLVADYRHKMFGNSCSVSVTSPSSSGAPTVSSYAGLMAWASSSGVKLEKVTKGRMKTTYMGKELRLNLEKKTFRRQAYATVTFR